MDDTDFIAGLMRENYEAVGFIPEPTVRHRYVAREQAIIQTDERGKRVGYLLHGAVRPGRDVVVTQHCIDIDKRLRGYGEQAVAELLRRAEARGVRAVRLRCAEGLPSLTFWEAMGFAVTRARDEGNVRNRLIYELRKDLWVPLLREKSG